MLKKILLGVLVIILGILGLVATRPKAFKIERSITINASADKVLVYLNNYKNWDEWSPWSKLDPAMKKTISGPEMGVGAIYEWESKVDDVGKGKMEITSVNENSVKMNLDFIEPFAAKNLLDFQMNSKDGKTEVKWVMTGENDFMGKAFDLVMNMDKMVGDDFDKGLSTLKNLVEKK